MQPSSCGVDLDLNSEVFRFALVRPPKRVPKNNSKINPSVFQMMNPMNSSERSGQQNPVKTEMQC
jgi:hypothetical protein